jgi:hypothetical protein
LAGKPPSGQRAAALFLKEMKIRLCPVIIAGDDNHQNIVREEEKWDKQESGRSSLAS